METATELILSAISPITLLTVFCFLVLLFLLIHPTGNLPPGPTGLPIVGYLPWMYGKNAHSVIQKLHEKYGSLISLNIGSRLVVILGTTDLMYTAFTVQGDNFAGKPRNSQMEIDGDEKGISISHGELWKEQRRFVLKTLRDFGVGKQIFEPEIKEEIKQFLKELSKREGKPIILHEMLGTSIANNICTLEFGKRFDYDDPLFKDMKSKLDELTFSLEIVHTPMYFPWMRIFPWIYRPKRKRELKNELYAFTKHFMTQHENNFDNEEHRDLIFAWMDERNRKLLKNNSEGFFTKDSLQFNLLSLFMAGTETTNSTVLTAIAHMAQNLDIQEKCRKEINQVVDRDWLPSTDDRNQLPYTEATLLEVQRLAGVNPLNLAHSTVEETRLNGYTIPKDTIIMANILGIHTNPKTWPDPFKFSPERFLTKDNRVINQDKIVPFSMGKRMCLGANLAKLEIFLYFTAMIQNFTFEPCAENPLVLDYQGGVVRRPKYFYVCAKKIE